MISSYVLFFFLQDATRNEIKSQLFEEQRKRQVESTYAITRNIDSDLTLILSHLDGISNSKYLQEGGGQMYSSGIKQLATEKYSQMSKIVDKLFILNDQDVVVFGISNSSNVLAPVGSDLSFRPWVAETKHSLKPVFSEAFEAVGQYRVFITVPVIDRQTREYIGMVGVSVPTVNFFEHYGNVHDINSQFLVAYDKQGTILAVGADESLVGLPFFGTAVQDFVNRNPTLNSHMVKLLGGQSGYAVYDYGRGERLTTYQPIYVDGAPTYFLQVVTPTATIYSQIDPILSRESGKLFLLLAATIAAAAVFVVFLLFWNSVLRKEVYRRTSDLQESNKLLAISNEKLKERDSLQREFINIAAHEMRTPIQPILGLSEMLREEILKRQDLLLTALAEEQNPSGSLVSQTPDADMTGSTGRIAHMLEVISRNAQRLDKLSTNLLDVSRIENNSLKLVREKVDLNRKIKNAVADANSSYIFSSYQRKKEDLAITFEPFSGPLVVYGDKTRLYEVILNLIYNAVKFTKKGTIAIKSGKQDGHAMVSVKDTGDGIDPEILARLFTKFATKSEKGVGLGLFISKNIVEAHGGKIWAENNKDGPGATFTFTLPLADSSSPD
jgi:signal transduction histidine kinase